MFLIVTINLTKIVPLSYLDEVLFDHVVEGGRDAVHGNGGVPHAQDTVELRRHEGHPGLRHRLREYLVLDVFACSKRAEQRQLLLHKGYFRAF
jgi:hypothetical protein